MPRITPSPRFATHPANHANSSNAREFLSSLLGHPGERIFTARSSADILGKLKNWTTTLDMQQFSQRHLGKWIRVQNTIRDIGIDGSTIFVIVGKEKFSPVVHLAFSREKWQANLESMNKGDRIAAEGIIVKIEYLAMYVGNCALVEERDEDDSF